MKPKPLGGAKLSLLQLTRMAMEQSGTVCRLARDLAALKGREQSHDRSISADGGYG